MAFDVLSVEDESEWPARELAVGECLRCLPLRPIEAHAFEESPPVALEARKLRALA
jgi:hypothetical protein